jgi:hypothetical protein
MDTLSAVGLAVEVGDFARFEHPKLLTSYLGLVPSEHSSGETRRQGHITKSGSRHARRLLVEAAWHYRRPPRLGTTLERRQEGRDQGVIAIAWKAQQRLHHVWCQLDSKRGKRRTIVAVAVARQLAGFCWAIVTHNPELPSSNSSSAGFPAGGRPPTQTPPNPRSRENGAQQQHDQPAPRHSVEETAKPARPPGARASAV